MNVRIIRDQSDYEAALEQLSALMDKKPVLGSEEEDLVELLLLVLKDFEEKNTHPIELVPRLKSFLKNV